MSTFPEPAQPRAANHASNAQHHERYAQPLTHIKHHPLLEIHLHLFAELNEETEGKDGGQAVAEEVSGADTLGIFLVDNPSYYKYNKVGNGLVELCRMAGELFTVAYKDKSPGKVGSLAHNLAVHQIS